ncbi:MAG: efflux RND transporter periplasmic adaptor subunit [Alphaproteobacteria bacterium]|nr:efflux RND transporter periplasmic adaptor subunit [Alphaproteobacteria bacterium]
MTDMEPPLLSRAISKPFALAGFFLILAACGESDPVAQNISERPKRPHLVEVVTIAAMPLRHETVRTGTLAARRSVRLFNQEEGRIDRVAVFEGEAVKKGQVLIELDRRLLTAELKKATAARKLAEADLERARRLMKRKITTQERLDQAEMQYSVALAEETLIRTRLAYGEVVAPFDGIVTERLVEPGDVAPRHTHLLTVIDPKSLYTKVSVSELMTPRLAEGDTVDVRVDALGEHAWSGRIQRIHPTVDGRTRQGVVEVALDPVPPGARAGQLSRVTLRTAELPRKTMPFASLQHDRDGQYVYVVKGERAQVRRVRTGLRLDDQVEVLDGVDDGDKVIVRGFLDLSPGKSVTVIADTNNKPVPKRSAARSLSS